MARKSRRERENEKLFIEDETPQKIKTAGYARVSIDKGEDKNTIESQLLMVRQFIETHPEYELVETYADVGYSGTNFERPDFSRMIEDVQTGKIECVIVKDLSRFGRNFIETGYYIETIFPRLNAKLIAINDDFDSSMDEDRKNFEIPVKNLINEMYAKDASKKYTNAFLFHSKVGDSKIGLPPYGYLKKDNELIEDPATADIVKLIFRWAADGLTYAQIASRLNMAEIDTPATYKNKNFGISFKENCNRWKSTMITDILKKQTYAGDTVQGRSRSRKYKNEYVRHVNKSEWIIHSNTHIPLVHRDDYEQIETRITQYKEQKDSKLAESVNERAEIPNLFVGKIFCANCGIGMKFMRYRHGSEGGSYDSAFYLCGNDQLNHCNRRVDTNYLKIVITDQVRHLAKVACDQKEVAQKIINGQEKSAYCLSEEKKIMNLEKKFSDLESTIENLYINYTKEIIDADDYKLLTDHYSAEKEEIRAEIKMNSDELKRKKKVLERYCAVVNDFSKVADSINFNQEFVDKYISQIKVGDRSIEIVFACSDLIEKGLEIVEESRL